MGHISVADANGNLAALTVSNDEVSGCVFPHKGIMMNNMLGKQYISPCGLYHWHTNTRMKSIMAPRVLKVLGG